MVRFSNYDDLEMFIVNRGIGPEKWKELKIENVPHDILVGDYEFIDTKSYLLYSNPVDAMTEIKNGCIVAYRYRQKPAPPHQIIMGNWFKHLDGLWDKVESYDQRSEKLKYRFGGMWVSAEYFSGLEAAEMPPEKS